MNDTQAAAKRLRPGQGLLGPEYAGCMNTGMRPLLLRARRPPTQGGNARWLVCVENDAPAAQVANVLHFNRGRRIVRVGSGRYVKQGGVRFFQSLAPALARYEGMCRVISEQNQKDRERAADLRKRAQVPDAEGFLAAMELADLGL